MIYFIEIYNNIISKIHKNFICVTRMRDEDQIHMHPSQPLSPTTLFPQPPHSGWGNTTQYIQHTSLF